MCIRDSQKSAALSFDILEPKGSKWHIEKYFAMAGNYVLMMFYTTVAGWMICYFFKMLMGDFAGLNADQVAGEFSNMLADPLLMLGFMVLVVVGCFAICAQAVSYTHLEYSMERLCGNADGARSDYVQRCKGYDRRILLKRQASVLDVYKRQVYNISNQFIFKKDWLGDRDIRKMRSASVIWIVCNEHISVMDFLIAVVAFNLVYNFQHGTEMHRDMLRLGNGMAVYVLSLIHI